MFSVAQTSLEMLSYCLSFVKEKPAFWQWVYISLHHAVQSYMVLALTGTHSLLPYQDDSVKKWLKCYENEMELPDCKLDSYNELYKTVKKEGSLPLQFIPSESQEKSIKRLNDLRNDFVHYKYGRYSLRMSDTPFQMVNDCLDFIEFLAFQSNNVFWEDETNKKNAEELLNKCRSLAKA